MVWPSQLISRWVLGTYQLKDLIFPLFLPSFNHSSWTHCHTVIQHVNAVTCIKEDTDIFCQIHSLSRSQFHLPFCHDYEMTLLAVPPENFFLHGWVSQPVRLQVLIEGLAYRLTSLPQLVTKEPQKLTRKKKRVRCPLMHEKKGFLVS